MKNLADITSQELHQAADIREQIDRLAHQLHVIFGLSSDQPKKKTWSEERRAKFKSTIKRRQELDIHFPSTKKVRKMSAAARAKISAAAKKRWKKAKAAGRNSI